MKEQSENISKELNRELIEKILDETLRSYGEFYGQSCYFNGKDGKKELPKDEFIELYKKRAVEKIMKIK